MLIEEKSDEAIVAALLGAKFISAQKKINKKTSSQIATRYLWKTNRLSE